MWTSINPATLLQIFYDLVINFKVILKSLTGTYNFVHNL